ncbi:MAG: bifunctional DNA primase/polymerase [Roseovarius sp.]|jgi:putative DNA primase/helicase|uniref:bifunctional DNA primase/polymerase n=1 Tax=Roseovarius sp. TaxID=1486281 RepID=UPI0032F00BD3
MSILDHAFIYAEAGWSVFPVHGIKDGRCTCGKQDCSSPGKHPLHAGGFKNATTELKTIEAWWSDHPNANIAIATGEVSGLFVIDIDCGPGKDGFGALAALDREFGHIPFSARVRTGSGGVHIYLNMPDRPFGCSTGKLGAAIDIRANGGYVVAPPSIHLSGKKYVWETPDDE